jgi:hypothetical protein
MHCDRPLSLIRTYKVHWARNRDGPGRRCAAAPGEAAMSFIRYLPLVNKFLSFYEIRMFSSIWARVWRWQTNPHHSALSEVRGGNFLRNSGAYPPNYTVLHSRAKYDPNIHRHKKFTSQQMICWPEVWEIRKWASRVSQGFVLCTACLAHFRYTHITSKSGLHVLNLWS